jgi:hypothetical protein
MSLTLHLPVDVSSERGCAEDHPHRDGRIKSGAMLTLAADCAACRPKMMGEGGHVRDVRTLVAHPFVGGGANPNVLKLDSRPHR